MDLYTGKYNNIRQIRKFLSERSAKTLIHAFMTSHLDHFNSLLVMVSLSINTHIKFNHITPFPKNCTAYMSIPELNSRLIKDLRVLQDSLII